MALNELRVTVSFGPNDVDHIFYEYRLFLFPSDFSSQSINQLCGEETRKAIDFMPEFLHFILNYYACDRTEGPCQFLKQIAKKIVKR